MVNIFLVPQFPTTKKSLTFLGSSSFLLGKPITKKKKNSTDRLPTEGLSFLPSVSLAGVVEPLCRSQPAKHLSAVKPFGSLAELRLGCFGGLIYWQIPKITQRGLAFWGKSTARLSKALILEPLKDLAF